MLMADMGATVIKVEPPWGGQHPQRLAREGRRERDVPMVNRDKDGLILDLGHPEGAAAFRRLVARVDVVVENYRPGTMEQLGLG